MLDQEPLPIASAHEYERAFKLFSKYCEFEIAFGQPFQCPFGILGGIDAGIPNHHCAAAVFAFGNHAFEVGVIDRMILDLHRKTFDVWIHRRAFGHGPRFQNTVAATLCWRTPKLAVCSGGLFLNWFREQLILNRIETQDLSYAGEAAAVNWRGAKFFQ